MNKQKLTKRLAFLHGIKLEYFDIFGNLNKTTYTECANFLKTIGLNIDKTEELEKQITETEYAEWSRWLPPIQVTKKPNLPVIHFRISSKDTNKTFYWTLKEENGAVHQGEFSSSTLTVSRYKSFKKTGTYYQLDLPLPVSPDIGYHKFILSDAIGNNAQMTLAMTPEKSYIPEGISKSKVIKGPALEFINPETITYRDLSYLRNAVKLVSKEKADTLEAGYLNHKPIIHFDSTTYSLPSSRIGFNVWLLDLEEMIDHLENKNLDVTVLLKKLNDHHEALQNKEEDDFNVLFVLRLKIYKLLYASFIENHIKKSTAKAQDFYNYCATRNQKYRKIAVFEALKEYLSNEDPELTNWQVWPDAYKNPYSDHVKQFEKNNIELVQFYEFLQWQVDRQLADIGRASYEKQLNIGFCANLNFGIDKHAAEAWLHQDFYAFDAKIKSFGESEEESWECPPLLPKKLKQDGYAYFIDFLRSNMQHNGAIKLSNLIGFDHLTWIVKDENAENVIFSVQYPLQDLLGILALESWRNKCLVITEDFESDIPKIKQAIMQYGVIPQSYLRFTNVYSEEEIKNLYAEQQSEKRVAYEEKQARNRSRNRIPLSTYRFQFNQGFTFNQAKEVVPYLKELGITHCYASPLLAPRSDSTHGYDIIDHTSLNPRLGSYDDFIDFVNELHKYDMGLIMDIVPNHMGIGKENKWWMDVLENGPSSEYACYFDIDWKPIKRELYGKVLVPILGDHYGNILSSGQLKFRFDVESGKLTLFYYEHEFPINPSSYPLILEHRLGVLSVRLGTSHPDYLEYLSIITEFKNLPPHTELVSERIKERNREKDIACRRLSELCRRNYSITEFIEENIQDYQLTGDSLAANRMHNLLEQQAYRLAYWRVSSDEINYRRFFDVNDLAGLSVDNPMVFTNTHSLIFELIENAYVDGLRIDHPDGLFDPTEYFLNLQLEAAKRLDLDFDPNQENLCGSDQLPIYIAVEKILAPFERLHKDWAVHGSVGYEFLNSVCHLFVDNRNEKKFSRLYQKFVNRQIDFNRLVIACKKLIMKSSLTGELNVLANYLNKISENYYTTRDYTLNSIRDTLVEIIANFPVYRTYITSEEKSGKDEDYIKWAVGAAKKQNPTTDPSIYDFIQSVLLLEHEEDKESPLYKEIVRFAMKFQQYTGPLMAKGLEDTTFYRYNRLIALNEVGGEPKEFGISINEFHNQNINRLNSCPYNMLSTSTHDTKRSEDVRMRLSAISEIPESWQAKITKFCQINKTRKVRLENKFAPSKNDEFLFYQTLLGIWPDKHPDEKKLNDLIHRLEQYMLKATREAKANTSWVNINTPYETAMTNYIRKILTSPEKHPFWKEFLPFQREIALRGYLNSASQVALKFTVPGVPDIYQGNEIINYSLVDPDNRRPVDYNHNRKLLHELKPLLNWDNDEKIPSEQLKEILFPFETGKLKLYLTTTLLNFRSMQPNLFKQGNYTAVETGGEKAENIVAFTRSYKQDHILVVIPRLIYNEVTENNPMPTDEAIWKDTHLVMPDELKELNWKNLFTKDQITTEIDKLHIKDVFKDLSVAVLFAKSVKTDD